MKKGIFSFLVLIALSVILLGWGSTGHLKINTAAGLSFNAQMIQFNAWITTLGNKASEADIRKSWDPTEGPKHYIDIDNYPSFISTGRIPQTLDSVIAIHGATFVTSNGTLPWATLTTFDSLKNCFVRRDWAKAVLFAADLGHYIADGHMPLHLTRNYDGQYTGNTGIHSRYESTMINAYISQITYDGMPIDVVPNVRQYIFNYIYAQYPFLDSIIAADNAAKALAGGSTSSTVYRQELWNRSKNFTIPLFKKSSRALAELMFTAWVQAGSPIISYAFIDAFGTNSLFTLEQNAPNPFQNLTTIKFNLVRNTDVLVQVFDMQGKVVATLAEGKLESGSHSIVWNSENVHAGMYYLMLKSGGFADFKKMMIVH